MFFKKKKKESEPPITKDDFFDFFIGFIFLPVILFWAGFAIRIHNYAFSSYDLQEGEAIMATSITAGVWMLLKKVEINSEPRKVRFFFVGILLFALIPISINFSRFCDYIRSII